MGLDATVYCNCWEIGRIRKQFSLPELIYVSKDGSLNHTGGEDLDQEFDGWLLSEACEHELGCFVHFRLGNVNHVAALRNELGRRLSDFPILLRRVLFSGTHCGDFLERNDILEMEQELRLLSSFKCQNESLNSALSLNKPISF